MKTRYLSIFLFGVFLAAAAPSMEMGSLSEADLDFSELQAFGQVVVMGDGEVFVGEPANRTRSGVTASSLLAGALLNSSLDSVISISVVCSA